MSLGTLKGISLNPPKNLLCVGTDGPANELVAGKWYYALVQYNKRECVTYIVRDENNRYITSGDIPERYFKTEAVVRDEKLKELLG